MNDYSELKRLADAATAGQWKAVDYGSFSGKSSHWYVETDDGKNVAFDDSGDPAPNHWEARGEQDMKFIAAANPSSVLALIAEVEALRKDAERFRHLMFNHVDWARNGKDDDLVVLEFGPYPSHKLRDSIDAAMRKGEQS